jgi:hypothetical protein
VVVVRISSHLEYDASVLARLLEAAGVEPDVAEYVGKGQA